jgi:hypothetical protein
MIVPFKFSAKATNIGSATQTGCNFNTRVLNSSNAALYNQTTSNSSILAGATKTFTLTPNYTPSTTTGYYRVAFQVNQAQTDEVPLNNRDTLDFFITDYQYARDEGPMEDEFVPNSLYAGQTYQVGNIFEGSSNTVKCASVAVAVGPGTSVGTTIQAKIYKNDFTDLQATSEVYSVNAWDINSVGQQKLITLKLPNALQLYADSVYIVMVGNTVGSQAFRVCRSGEAIEQTCFVRYPENNGLFFLTKMPVVRMNIFTDSQTPGCTNPLANNYLPTANIDDGSCDIPGCIFQLYSNFNPNATWYDGSCVLDGCTISTACNYSPLATVNNGSCIMPTIYYADSDQDSYGSPGSSISACSQPTGYVTNFLDCNDNNNSIKPGAAELCNLIDDNCNGQIDEGLAFANYYFDADTDGYGNPLISVNACALQIGYVSNNSDCNDNNNSINPGAAELCNLIDDNCNGQLSEGLVFVNYYIDSDSDGFGAGSGINSCAPPVGLYVTDNSDCNNNNSAVKPSANEICNSIDDNCNNAIDEGLVFSNYFLDADLDGYYISITSACGPPGTNYTSTSTTLGDCNDLNFNINAGALEICGNSIDENCDLIDPICIINGCTNPIAQNYNPQANQENGTCIISGCTDINAANFNPVANANDNSCLYPGCTDPFANNFNPAANTDDFSCEYLTPTISVSELTLCENQNFILYNQTQFSDLVSCWVSFGDGSIENSCQQTYTHQYANAGEYVIQFIYFQGNTYSIASTDTITVNPNPTNLSVGLDFPNVFSSTNNPNYTIEWLFNGISLQNYQEILNGAEMLLSDGYYQAKFKNEFGCQALSDSIYYLLPSFEYNQENPCEISPIVFENTTQSDQEIECYFINSQEPGLFLPSPYNYTLEPLETITVSLFCSFLGNNYYSLSHSIIESNNTPNAPELIHQSQTIEALNMNENSIQWFLSGIPLNLNPNDSIISTFLNNEYQSGTFSAVYTNEFGCNSDTASIFIIDINVNSDLSEGCYPVTATIINETTQSEGIQCEIMLNGADYLPFNDSVQYTFQEPGIFQPQVHCYSGIHSASYTMAPITIFGHPETPTLTSSNGQVNITNNNAGNSVGWYLDGIDLELSTNSISTFFNGIYDNGYYSASFTDIHGCSATSEPLLVIQPRYELISGAVCAPVTAVLSNTTDPVDGMTCVINDGLGGQNIPFNLSVDLTYIDAGSFAPEMTCSVGSAFGTYTDTIIQVYPNPVPSSLNYSNGLITATDLPASSSISWTLNGNALNLNTNPLNIGPSQISGYFYGTITNEFGCTSNTDSLLQIFPSFNLSQTQGCGPLSIQANNTTPSFNGMTCVIQSNGIDYPIGNFIPLNYSAEGDYSTSLSCSLDGSIFTATGPTVTVFPNAPTPVLSWAYGAVLCSNCTGLSTQYFLDDIAFTQGSSAVSTLQNGVYQNGYYTAQSSSAQGCLSSISLPVLVVQPALNFTPSEGCAPLQSTFVNSTDFVEGLSCELFLGNGNGNIPLSYLEAYNYSYSNPNTYSPYLSCYVGNTVANSPSASLVVNGGTIPELIFDAGFVTCMNCANQDNITWIIDGTLTIDSISNVPDSLGTFFSCDYINQFGCSANSFIVSVIEENVPSFNLFPNPVRDLLSISGLAQTSTLEIRDAQGRLVFKELGRGTARTINTSEFSNGFYTITETSTKIFRSGTLLVNH